MHSAAKNKTIRHWQRCFNRLVSKVRYKVKQAFETAKRRFKFNRAFYFGTEKVLEQRLLEEIAFNLPRGVNITQCCKMTAFG